jgi:hypothetical protein
MSQTPHSENGLEKNSSEQKPPKEDIGDIGSKTNPNSQTHHKMNNHLHKSLFFKAIFAVLKY